MTLYILYHGLLADSCSLIPVYSTCTYMHNIIMLSTVGVNYENHEYGNGLKRNENQVKFYLHERILMGSIDHNNRKSSIRR